MTTHLEERLTSADGSNIYWQAWVPESPRAVVVIAHGVAEHSGRYAHVGEALSAAGLATYAVDHHGHGRSEGKRANIGRMSGVVADLHLLVGEASARHDGLPVFLLGHSMGGLVAVTYAFDHQAELTGLILSAPAVTVSVGSAVERKLAPVLSALMPNLGVLQLDSSDVSRDPAVVSAYDSDPLNFRGKLPARTGAEILAACDAVPVRVSTLTVPVLVVQGSADRLVSPDGAHLVYEGASSKDKQIKVYEGLYHEVLNEPEQDEVIGDIVAWVDQRIPSAA